jgi:hypothetical protein
MEDYLTIIIIAAIIIFVVGRRLIGSTKGTKYSTQSIFLRPVIYIVLSAVLAIGLELWQAGVLAIAIVLGVFIGMKLGARSDIFEKDGKILYKRSNEVMIIWIIAFVVRIALNFVANPALVTIITNSSSLNATTLNTEIAASQGNPIIFFADILLAVSAGLLFGEALILYRNFNSKYKDKKQNS